MKNALTVHLTAANCHSFEAASVFLCNRAFAELDLHPVLLMLDEHINSLC
jgi:hypothetical protein